MKDQIKWVLNRMPKSDDQQLSIMALPNVAKARFFHGSFPQYSVTPLARLDGMAKYLGLGGLYVKDESYRFGLNAFKVLGGSFAMARYIASEMGRDVSEMTYDYLTSEAFRKEFGQATFFTATDGNHGRGVAWAANKLGQKAVVHMPKGSSQSRYDNIAREGAQVTIEDVNYDDCVRMAAAEAAETKHGVVVQDTAWEGYEEIPTWIMQGYGTMASEAAEQMRQIGVNRPTHVFIRPASAPWPARWSASSPTSSPMIRPSSSSWRLAQPTVSMRVLWPATATLVSSRVISKPSWPVLPAASPTSSPGIS